MLVLDFVFHSSEQSIKASKFLWPINCCGLSVDLSLLSFWIFLGVGFLRGEFEEFWSAETQEMQICHQKSTSLCEIIPPHLPSSHLLQARQLLTTSSRRHSESFPVMAKRGWTLLMTLWNVKGRKVWGYSNEPQPAQTENPYLSSQITQPSRLQQIRAPHRLLKLCCTSDESRRDELQKPAPWKESPDKRAF